VAAPRITRLVVSRSGRRLLIGCIVLGVLLNVGQIVVAIALGGQTDRALRAVDREYHDVIDAYEDYLFTAQDCAAAGDLPCVLEADGELGEEVFELAVDLGDIDFPSYALGDAESLQDAAIALSGLLDEMSVTSDAAAHDELAEQIEDRVVRMDDAYFELRDTLRFG
jgi:hypothetical protein